MSREIINPPSDILHIKELTFGIPECARHYKLGSSEEEMAQMWNVTRGDKIIHAVEDLETNFVSGAPSFYPIAFPYRGHLHNFYLGDTCGVRGAWPGVRYRRTVYHYLPDGKLKNFRWSRSEINKFREFLNHFNLDGDEQLATLDRLCTDGPSEAKY